MFDSWWVLVWVGRFHRSLGLLSRVDEFSVNYVQPGLNQISTLRIGAIAETWRTLAPLGWTLVNVVAWWWWVLGLFEHWSGKHTLLLLVLVLGLWWRRFNHFLLWLLRLITIKKLFGRLAPLLLLLLFAVKWIPFAYVWHLAISCGGDCLVILILRRRCLVAIRGHIVVSILDYLLLWRLILIVCIFEALSDGIELLECQIGGSLSIVLATSPVKAFAQVRGGLAWLDVAVGVALRIARLVLAIASGLAWLGIARDFAVVFNFNLVLLVVILLAYWNLIVSVFA